MAIIHKAIKSKPWIVRYKEPWSGKARTKSFLTQAEAKAFDEAQSQVFDRERKIIKATKRRRKLQAAPSITVADVIDRYLDSLTNLRTRKSCAHHLKSIRDIFGTRKAHCMTLEDMDSFLKVQHERGVGRTTANRRAGLLRTACNHAVRWGLLSVNPLASMRLAAQPRQTPDPPTLHEAKLIYNSASEHVQRVVLLGLATGARIGPSELFRLRWSDVDLEHATLRMPQAASQGSTCRGESRTNPAGCTRPTTVMVNPGRCYPVPLGHQLPGQARAQHRSCMAQSSTTSWHRAAHPSLRSSPRIRQPCSGRGRGSQECGRYHGPCR